MLVCIPGQLLVFILGQLLVCIPGQSLVYIPSRPPGDQREVRKTSHAPSDAPSLSIQRLHCTLPAVPASCQRHTMPSPANSYFPPFFWQHSQKSPLAHEDNMAALSHPHVLSPTQQLLRVLPTYLPLCVAMHRASKTRCRGRASNPPCPPGGQHRPWTNPLHCWAEDRG